MAALIGHQGLRHAELHVRCRAAYFLLKVTEGMEGKASLLLPVVGSLAGRLRMDDAFFLSFFLTFVCDDLSPMSTRPFLFFIPNYIERLSYGTISPMSLRRSNFGYSLCLHAPRRLRVKCALDGAAACFYVGLAYNPPLPPYCLPTLVVIISLPLTLTL